jgi:hypothetical protein
MLILHQIEDKFRCRVLQVAPDAVAHFLFFESVPAPIVFFRPANILVDRFGERFVLVKIVIQRALRRKNL